MTIGTMNIAFIGLGQMGKPMALNMLKRAPDLLVSAADTSSYPEFERQGARTTTRVADTANADIVFLSLPNADVVRAVLLGDDGIARHLSAGKIVVDTSTIDYSATVEIAAALAEKGVYFIDAPVSGMEARAIDATLTAMCGGAYAIFEKVEPYLATMANHILYMGEIGAGQLTKLINQLLFDINAAALAEVLPMAVKLGLDPDRIGSVINSGTGRSYASEFFIPRILGGNFSSGYPMQHAYKDLVSAAEVSGRQCIPMPVLAAATATYQTALLKGLGKLDKGAMVKVYEELNNVSFRSKAAVGETAGAQLQ
ncbi:NAD(P)-dependent oxidoreductase [Paraburkholderia xenovorans]|uniref:NAD(P)-dependent oxidoreductase n=1 Tax=Paraburkholderia xenovorans TaxID=36873 RepID=UPI0038B6CEF3